MKKPATQLECAAGRAGASIPSRQIMQGSASKRTLQPKPRLDAVKGDSVACRGLSTAGHSVERLLWELGKPDPVRKLRGCRAGERMPSYSRQQGVTPVSVSPPKCDGSAPVSMTAARQPSFGWEVVLCP